MSKTNFGKAFICKGVGPPPLWDHSSEHLKIHIERTEKQRDEIYLPPVQRGFHWSRTCPVFWSQQLRNADTERDGESLWLRESPLRTSTPILVPKILQPQLHISHDINSMDTEKLLSDWSTSCDKIRCRKHGKNALLRARFLRRKSIIMRDRFVYLRIQNSNVF